MLSFDTDVLPAIHSAVVAEIAWTQGGLPDAQPVTPLVLAGQPTLALPYAYEEFAHMVGASPVVVLTLSDPRMTGSGWRPMAIMGKPRLVMDPDGDVFTEQLLDQELRKYPPSRALADSPLLRREHWWYLPRLLVLVEDATAVPIPARTLPGHLLLAVESEYGLAVDTVQTEPAPSPAPCVQVTSLSGGHLPDGAAALLGHDFSVPDLERWTPWVTRGRLGGHTFLVTQWPDRTTLEPTLGVWQRLRRHQQLEKDCRRALDADADS
jgi:hypothetical protein